ncbi:MAG: hypothetical protein LC115_13765 [Bacteroidia bacterium]|nr:hypothetical protein [Bacteroidia bacterium]
MQTTAERELESLSPDQLQDFVTAELDYFSQAEYYQPDADNIRRIFKLIHALLFLEFYEEAIQKIHQAEEIVYAFLEQTPNATDAIDFAAEWNLLAMRFTAFSKDEFKDYPYFKEIVRLYANHPSGFHIQMVHGYVSLILNYQTWKDKGGDVSKLSENQYQELETLLNSYPKQLQELIQEAHHAGDIEKEVLLNRAVARYASAANNPNLAISCLQALLNILPQYTQHIPSDIADVDMEIAMILVNYKQYSQAKRYFEQAFTGYQALGEDYELFAAQAEGWITECTNKSR